MDLWQGGRQLAEKLLAAATWQDAPNNLVLTTAFVSEDEEGNFLPDPVGGLTPDGPISYSLPFARVSLVRSERDHEVQGRILRAIYLVWVVAGGGGIAGASGTNDSHGINQVKGVNRDPVQPQGKSLGRDVDEICERLIEGALGGGALTDSTHGLQGYVSSSGEKVAVDGVQILARSIEVTVYNATVSRLYHAPTSFKATASGGGSVALSWTNPPSRFDTYQNVLRRGTNPGDPAPSSPIIGTGITISGGVLGTTATDPGHVASQTFNYSLFHLYSEVTTGDRVSSAVTAAVTVA